MRTIARFVCRAYGAAPHFWHLLLLGLLVLGAFGQSLGHGFVWDDDGLIVQNEKLHAGGEWRRVFFASFWAVGENFEDSSRSFYRPLISLSYELDYRFWGLEPRGFHLTNLLAHGVCAALVYLLGLAVLGTAPRALFAAALFAVHAAHVENVAWISGRTDVFCGMFYFLALWCFVKWFDAGRSRPLWLAGMALGYVLSLLSKEMALSFPLVAAAYYILCGRDRASWRVAFPAFGILFSLTFQYMLMRVAVLGHVAGPSQLSNVRQQIALTPYAFAKYLGLLLGLVPVDPHHGEEIIGELSNGVLLGHLYVSLGYVLWVGYLVWRKRRLSAFLSAFVGLSLLPVLKLGTFGDVLYADRFLYVPSFGFACLLVAGAAQWVGRRAARPALRFGPGVAYGAFLLVQLGLARTHTVYWRSNLTLFARAARTSPRSAYIHFNHGNSLLKAGSCAAALPAYDKALALRPSYADALANKGVAFNKLGRYERALDCLSRAAGAVQGRQRYVVNCGLGDAYRQLGKLRQALVQYRLSLRLRETEYVHNNIGECLLAMRRFEPAARHFERALALKPSPYVCNNLGFLFIEQGKPAEAVGVLSRALAFPADVLSARQELMIRYNLARAWLAQHDARAAEPHARRGLELLGQVRLPERQKAAIGGVFAQAGGDGGSRKSEVGSRKSGIGTADMDECER